MLAQMLRRHAPPTMTLTYVTSATSAGTSITIPSGAAVGDLAVLYDLCQSFYWPSPMVTPTGWTTISDLSSSPSSAVLSFKKLVSGDPGSSINGMTKQIAGTIQKIMLIFSPSGAISTVTVQSMGEQVTDSNPSAITVASQATLPYVAVGACGASAAPTWASAWYTSTFTNANAKLAYKIFNSAPASVSVDIGDAGDKNFLHACALVVT